MKFAEKIRMLRKANKMTQTEVAEALGMSRVSYSAYEVGGKYPRNHKTYYLLAELFNCDKNFLLLEDEEDEEGDPGVELSRCNVLCRLGDLVSEFKKLVDSGKLTENEIEVVMADLNAICDEHIQKLQLK